MEVTIEEKQESLAKYKRLSNALRSELKGKGYIQALKAFNFGEEHHTGFRKDGKTPNFQHQIEICLFILTLKDVAFEEDSIVCGLLHDVREDHNITHETIKAKFGDKNADVIEKLTKEFMGTKKDTRYYFEQIATCPIASLVKLADRVNNVSSMVGVFTIPKQEHYIFEIKEYFLPLTKIVGKRFPEQLSSYYAMKTFLKTMVKTVEAVLDVEKKLESLTNKTPDEESVVKKTMKMK